MKKCVWIIILAIIILSVCFCVYYFNTCPYKVIMKDVEGSEYYVDKNGKKFIQILKNGKITEYDNIRKTMYNYYKKNIIDVSYNDSSSSSDANQMIIYSDGSVYFDNNLKFEGDKIGQVDGAISGSIGKYHAAIITQDKNLFVYGHNINGALGLKDITFSETFVPVEGIKDIIKVACGEKCTFVLNSNGEIYGCGTWINLISPTFVKFDTQSRIIDIKCVGRTLVALDDKGNILESHFGGNLSSYSKKFSKIDYFSNAVFFNIAANKGVALNSNGKIHCWGSMLVGKAGDEELNLEIHRISKVEKVYNGYNCIYAIKEGSIYLIPIPK